ncbi:sigma-54 dependent transcriptional regulator [Pedobacter sp. SYP-B3415]|uniref:sigma-54-dependent transcriptional regulator n=1 Tax=Pedobacter sp. SYP-B3415 TaxID=2496641 RepID=UPI00101CD5B2|nr:sigma-54 dependent transcriptional regulator [Pedobacter sp. SYP-B3415]
MQQTVLIIDDEKKLCDLLARIIGLEGYHTLSAYTAKEGLRLLKTQQVSVVLSDVKLPDFNGVALVKEIKKISPATEVINLTAFGNIRDGVEAVKNGAFDYLTKADDNDRIIPLVSAAARKANLQFQMMEQGSRKDMPGLSDVIGQSPAIREAVELARKVAGTDTTVLLLGETGTGKEVFARAIHAESARNKGPFVAINCSAFSATLLESELFGYRAGAFTGADKDKKGLFEEAAGGTILLDEIGEMDLELQAKLLRVLESRTFIKVGDTKTTAADLRVIGATNRNLQQEAADGKFRSDLFYRLSVFSIPLPPLRQRRSDIPVLAAHYLDEFGNRAGRTGLKFDAGFSAMISRYDWKGNIRELKNVIERAVILAEGDVLSAELLPADFHGDRSADASLNMQSVEKQHIRKVLAHTHGNKTETARLLGIGLTTLYRKIEEYGI